MMDASLATEWVRSHPSFLPRLREYVEMARDGTLWSGLDLPSEDIELMRQESLRNWEPELELLEQRARADV